MIDANVYSVVFEEENEQERSGVIWWWFYIPGILSSTALVMFALDLSYVALSHNTYALPCRVNVVSIDALSDGGMFSSSSTSTTFARLWMFLAFILSFAGLLGSGWIMIARYLVPIVNEDGQVIGLPKDAWPGVALLLQNILIFLSAIVFRFGRIRT